MKVLRITISGQASRQRWMRSRFFSPLAGRFMRFSTSGWLCWNGTSRYGSTRPAAISGTISSTLRVRVHVVQAHPGAVGCGNLAQRLHQLQHARLDRLAVPEARAVLHVHAVGRGVLADHQQLLHAAFEQRLGLGQHIADGRDTRSPRIDGMMQKVQRWLQPSLIFR